jgi:class 3 adenylate cyclase
VTGVDVASDAVGKGSAGKLMEILDRFFGTIIRVVKQFGGDIMKFSGDALTIFFNVESADSGSAFVFA